MRFMKGCKTGVMFGFISLPTVFSAASAATKSMAWLLIAIASVFLVIALLPVCRKRESIWMFIAVAIAGIPINIRMVSVYMDFMDISGFAQILWGAVIYTVLFSIEELVFGTVTRFIWRKQYKLL